MPISTLKKQLKATKPSQKKVTPTELILDILYSLPHTKSLSEVEAIMLKKCQSYMGLSSVIIKYKSADPVFNNELCLVPGSLIHVKENQLRSYTLSLDLTHKEIEFRFTKNGTLKAGEKKILNRLVEHCHPFFKHFLKIQEYEILQKQWQLTFDSITTPLCITNSHLNLLKANKSFMDACNSSTTSLIGKSAFQSLFGKEYVLKQKFSPVDKISNKKKGEEVQSAVKLYEIILNKPTRILKEDSKETFSVTVENIGAQTNKQLYLIRAENITHKLKIEQQILKSTKIAELGIVSSSIAHELNNPLGGVISFLHLIKSDMKKDSYGYDDILALEKSALRCKDIVQRLLSFSRKSFDNPPQPKAISIPQVRKKLLTKGSSSEET